MKEIRILTVDDEIDVCAMLVQFFRSAGYKAEYALNGKQAIDLVNDFAPHFIFLDVMMPEMSGIDVLRAIRDIDKSVKVIMISGMHDLGMAKEAMKLGAMDYMPKPIKLEDLNNFLKKEVQKLQSSGGSEKVESLMKNNDWD